ncbi:class I SAM-dependent methyltransferase [Gammaproteobacteria bacterium]|nr:class I SAM-dependent methyltransferase [Gammaproteobacteria bacterium]
MKKHDLKDGMQSQCQICGNEDLKPVVDLGTQPLSDKLQRINEELKEETSYPLIQVWCEDCGLNQLKFICPSEIMFGDDYSYKTGVTEELVTYQAQMAAELVNILDLNSKDLVCDLGSNDGTLLKGFVKTGVRVIGVEPTDIADTANKEGIPTLRMPFGEEAANSILEKVGEVSLATATNVFAHVQQLGDFMRGLEIALKEDGYFCFENHYLGQILNDSQYDTIYHEHLRSLSVSAVVNLFSQYNFTVIQAKQTSRYGGNIRVLVKKGSHSPLDNSVEEMLQKEKDLGYFNQNTYDSFSKNASSTKIDLLQMLINLKKEGKTVAGYSLPARAMTLINYVGLDSDLMPYVVEQKTSLKLNRYVPGTRIPVLSNECLEENKPDYLVIFAWHLKNEIIEHLRSRGIKGTCIIPLPEVHLVEL